MLSLNSISFMLPISPTSPINHPMACIRLFLTVMKSSKQPYFIKCFCFPSYIKCSLFALPPHVILSYAVSKRNGQSVSPASWAAFLLCPPRMIYHSFKRSFFLSIIILPDCIITAQYQSILNNEP